MKLDPKGIDAAKLAVMRAMISDNGPIAAVSAIEAYCKAVGVVMVPVEPTDDMVAAACMDGLRSARSGHKIEDQVHAIYRAMIEASQEDE